jgi:hypothetical protein
MGTKTLMVLLCAAVLAGCGGAAGQSAAGTSKEGGAQKQSGGTTGEPKGADEQAGEAKEGEGKETRQVELTPEQVARLGVVTTAVQEARYAATSEGFGVVISHEVVAQAAADLQTALAAVKQSQAAVERAQRLSSGPGALGADVLENAQRQHGADEAAVQLARRKLTALFGVGFPWQPGRPKGQGDGEGELRRLADGTHELLRVTFPPSSSVTGTPRTLRISSIDALASAWVARTVWPAPQDPSLPGRSVFAVLTDSTLAEGARVRAQSSTDASISGVIVPETAVVITDGQYWCYVEKKDGLYRRVAIDASRPLGNGYFVSDGVAAGDRVVTSGAGLVLARELNASTGAED